jgi:hypothetical protein
VVSLPRPRVSRLLAEWPRLRFGTESRQFSSFDRAGGNDDGFAGTYSELYADANGEHVIFDAVGPGRLNTLWFTSAVSGDAPLGLGRVRFYFDDADVPKLEVDADRLFSGAAPGFPSSLVFDNHHSTGGYVSYVPIAYATRLKITTERKPAFYSAQYDTFPVDAVPETDASEAAASFGAPVVDDDGGDGDEVPLSFERVGPGLVTRLVFRPDGAPTREALRAARVRLTWEDEPTPAVDVPADTFFGSALGEAPVSSVAFSMAPGRWVNRMPMPFWRRVRVEIVGVAGRLFLRVEQNPYEERSAAHLRAVWREERPTASADDFEYVHFEGAGRLVATVLGVEPPDAARDKQWWEGDLRSYADGRRTPGIQGTGYEDDHFGGWSNEFFSTPFSLPLHGEPRVVLGDRNGQYNGDVSLYRLWPGISFATELRHGVEHGTGNNRAVGMSAATFLYAEPRARAEETDRLDLCDADARVAHQFISIGQSRLSTSTSTFEGRDRAQLTHCHLTVTGTSAFLLTVRKTGPGFWLRRWFDQSQGRQSATVHVANQRVGRWLVAESNASARWAERDFFVPASFTLGADRVLIAIEPDTDPASVPWDAAEYRAISILPDAPRP